MPLTGDFDGVRKLRADVKKLTTGADLLRGIDREVKGLLKEEFATGQGPYGAWQNTVRGRQALQSRKLPQAFTSELQPNGLRYMAKSKRDLLTAHQEGYKFPARQRAANQQFLTFNKGGKLIKNSRALNKKGETKRGVYQRFAKAHTVGARVLPQRQIVPEGDELPPAWKSAVTRGAEAGVQRWYDRTSK
jgi:hypothetical protein